jgi:PAS domain S-box-containing protein
VRTAVTAAVDDRQPALPALAPAMLAAPSGHAVIATDRDGVIRGWSRGAERLLGWRACEVVGLRTPQFLHDAVELRAVAAGAGRPVDGLFESWPDRPDDLFVRTRYRHREGNWISVLLAVSAVRDGAGMVVGSVGVATAPTAQEAADALLRAERDFMESVIEHAGALVIVTDGQGGVVRLNNACAGLAGLSDAPALDPWTAVAPDAPDSARAVFAAAAAGPLPRETESTWLGADGRPAVIRWTHNTVKVPGGPQHHVVSVGFDVTSQRAREARLLHEATRDPFTGYLNKRGLRVDLTRG